MRYDELLVESKYSLHIKLIERIFATELLGELNARLDQLHKEIAKNPDRFALNALWPSDIQNVYAIFSPFSGFRNSVPKAIERAIINDQIISAFNVTGAVIISIDRNLKRNSAGYSREGTSQLKDITSLISHPIYDRFKAGPIDKNDKKHAIVYQRVWRRFVKHIVLNIQHYIESDRPRRD